MELRQRNTDKENLMQAKRLTDSELRNASAKKAKIARQGQQNVITDPEPQGLYAEFIDKHSLQHTDMQEWMKQVKQISEALLTITDPTDASVNEICETSTMYGCSWNQVLPLLIQAAVKDNKYAIDVNRINTSNVTEEFRNTLQVTKHIWRFGEYIPIGQMIDGGSPGAIKVKVIRGNWYNKPTDITIDMTMISEFVHMAHKEKLFKPLWHWFPDVAISRNSTPVKSLKLFYDANWPTDQQQVSVTAEQARFQGDNYANMHHVVAMVDTPPYFMPHPDTTGVKRLLPHYLKRQLMQFAGDKLADVQTGNFEEAAALQMLVDGEYDLVWTKIQGRNGYVGSRVTTETEAFWLVTADEAEAIELRNAFKILEVIGTADDDMFKDPGWVIPLRQNEYAATARAIGALQNAED